METRKKYSYTLLQDNKFRILSGSFLSRVFISLVTGAFLGFLFSFLLIYNENISGSNEDFGISFLNIRNSNQVSTGDGDLVDYLYNDVRILCIVMTEPDAVEQRTQFIKETWGKRCNKLIHISTKPDPLIPDILVMQGNDTQNFTYARTRATFKYIYKHYLNDFDWFLKADDDNYFIMENLRHLLYQYSADWPLVIGQKYLEAGYMMGPYILSRKALIHLVEQAFPHPQYCDPSPDLASDIMIHECLQNVNVLSVDANKDGKGRFFYEPPEISLFPVHEGDSDKWYWHKLKQGINQCCSEYPILFRHYWYVHFFYIEYLVYKVQAFGIVKNPEVLPNKLALENVIKNL